MSSSATTKTNSWNLSKSLLYFGSALMAGIIVLQDVGCLSAPAQRRPDSSNAVRAAEPDLPTTADAVIQQMSRTAGVVFAGQVMEIRWPSGFAGSGEDAAAGAVEIDFRVEQAVRGTLAGSVYTVREWAGLWAGGNQRYRVGQRLLMLLHAQDAHGFSSPVRGLEGAVPLRGGGLPPGPDDVAATSAEFMVDMRWIHAQVLRTSAWAPEPPSLPGRQRRADPPLQGGRSRESASRQAEIPGRLAEVQGREVLSEDLRGEVVRALSGPWNTRVTIAGAQSEPLSRVLNLCRQRELQDALR